MKRRRKTREIDERYVFRSPATLDIAGHWLDSTGLQAIKAVPPVGPPALLDTDAITAGVESYDSELSERNKLKNSGRIDGQTDGRTDAKRAIAMFGADVTQGP